MKQHIEALKDSKYCPLWQDQEDKPEVLPPLLEDVRCELLIVGGGFTGLWAALQVKERAPETDVILIEKTFVADGASGRNGGFLTAQLGHGETNTLHHFPEEFDRINELGQQNMTELLDSLKKYNIDARYEAVGETEVATCPETAGELYQKYLRKMAENRDFVWFDQEAMQKEVNSHTYLAGLWRREGKDGIIDPCRLCWGLKETILKLGVKIYENTSLEAVEPLGKDKMLATTAKGKITADKVLMATNGYPTPINQINKSFIPIWDYQIATEPLTQQQLDSIGWHKTRHALSNSVNMFHYYRMTKDNRITWGGGGAVRYYYNNGTHPKFGDVKSCFEQLSKEFFQTFPQLKGVKFSHRWSGIIATSSRFCMIPDTAYDGRMAWTVGYTGAGVAASRFGARIGIELLGYQPSDILEMEFVTRKPMPWAPEPIRWLGVRFTQRALVQADINHGKRGWWLKLLDFFNLGFTC